MNALDQALRLLKDIGIKEGFLDTVETADQAIVELDVYNQTIDHLKMLSCKQDNDNAQLRTALDSLRAEIIKVVAFYEGILHPRVKEALLKIANPEEAK